MKQGQTSLMRYMRSELFIGNKRFLLKCICVNCVVSYITQHYATLRNILQFPLLIHFLITLKRPWLNIHTYIWLFPLIT